MVTISEERKFLREFDLLRKYLKCDSDTLTSLVEHSCDKYPYLSDRSQGVFMVAREKNLEFVYENNMVSHITEMKESLDVDISDYLG